MEKVDTDSLRLVSSKWSLGGDKRLLNLLENIHQKVITKCSETNTKLDELINKLDTASIDLQNVNNKFMALSNTQFIERRVYDDDVDIAPPVEPPKEPPKIVDPNEDLEKLKRAIQTFETMHEVVQILDSDSSDDEDEDEERLVLKLRNVYADRPLPYIIGSDLWRTKWHAGLVVEDSDSDSAGSKHEPGDEYSDSEPEVTDTQTDKLTEKDTWISSSTSVEASVSASSKAKPADIAAELARRLGGDTIPPPPPMEAMPEPITKQVYRPQQPAPATIFSNEPPPLDQVESESDEDIFAELHRNRYTQNDRTRQVANVVDELFGNVESAKLSNTEDKQTLFDGDSESELFVEKHKVKEDTTEIAEKSDVKKPVGGISLFGSNKNSNSIGAAILKRQQPKSSDENDSSESPIKSNNATHNLLENPISSAPVVTKVNQDKINSLNNNKNIIENLFAKPKSNKTSKKEIEDKIPEKKVDLFSDDLFDDIDDIFTSKITKTSNTKTQEKLFDSEDDLFSENILPNSKKSLAKRSIVFSDSDDDLFKEETDTKNIMKNSTSDNKEELSKNGKNELDQKSKSILGNEIDTSESDVNRDYNLSNKDLLKENKIDEDNLNDDSKIESNVRNETASLIISDEVSNPNLPLIDKTDSDLSNVKIMDSSKSNLDSQTIKSPKMKENNTFTSFLDTESDDDLFKDNDVSTKVRVSGVKKTIFDDDSEGELFGNTSPLSKKQIKGSVLQKVNSKESILNTSSSSIVPEEVVKKNISIITDDSDEELFDCKSKKPIAEEMKNSGSFNKSMPNFTNDQGADNNLINDFRHEEGNIEQTGITSTIEDQKTNLDVTVNTDFQSPLVFNNDEMDELLSSKSKKSMDFIENTPDNKKQSLPYLNAAENSTEAIIESRKSNELINAQTKEDALKESLEPQLNVSSQNTDDDQMNEFNQVGFHEKILKESKIVYTYIEEDKNNLIEPIDKETSPFSKIFNDIPPEFEKPKEPKKSKNINALFDDDSDDESMFFKKSSDVSDELPSSDYTHERFSIFHDEPPAIEVDFSDKSTRTPNNDDEEIIVDTHTELNKDLNIEPKLESSHNFNETNILDRNIKKDSFKNNFGANTDESPQILENSIKSTNAIIADKINNLQADIKQPIDGGTIERSIGKLKPVNFNINVNTLLPGAAPKKTKLVEELDGSASSKVDTKEVEEKSVHFKEKDSNILDNKLSKERAKIQVKRRPSTRRARKEAAKKSGIDFGDSIDSTDNSSSIDEPKRVNKSGDTKVNVNEVESIKNNNLDANKDTESSKSTTKVVYILNDEDIFSQDNKNFETDLLGQDVKSLTSKTSNPSPTDNKDNNQNSVDKKSIFDLSDSETELFGASKTNVKKTKLFESDSDDDDNLFRSNKEAILKKDKQKPLFTDESDDELFSYSNKSNEKKVSHKPSEPVFEDPLTMLNQDDG